MMPRRIAFDGAGLSAIPAEVLRQIDLESLSFFQNALRELPDALWRLTQLLISQK